MTDGNRVSPGLIGRSEPSQGGIDLDRDRLRIEFVKVVPGSSGKELGSAHTEVPGPCGSALEGFIGDGNSGLHATSITRYDRVG